MSKKTIIITLLLLCATGLTTWYTLKLVKTGSKPHITQPDTPDMYVNQGTFVQMDKNGTPRNVIKTPRLVHYPLNDSTTFASPNITITNPKQAPFHITAEHGSSKHGTNVVILKRNVLLQQPQTSKNRQLTIKTSAATVYLHKRFIETDQPVKLLQPGLTVSAVGAKVNLVNKSVRLLSKIHETYDPRIY